MLLVCLACLHSGSLSGHKSHWCSFSASVWEGTGSAWHCSRHLPNTFSFTPLKQPVGRHHIHFRGEKAKTQRPKYTDPGLLASEALPLARTFSCILRTCFYPWESSVRVLFSKYQLLCQNRSWNQVWQTAWEEESNFSCSWARLEQKWTGQLWKKMRKSAISFSRAFDWFGGGRVEGTGD